MELICVLIEHLTEMLKWEKHKQGYGEPLMFQKKLTN